MAINLKRTLYETLATLHESYTGEIIDGQLHATPRPAPRHAVAASGLLANVHRPFHRGRDGPGGWWIVVEPEVHFIPQRELSVPDIAGWRRERMPTLPDGAFFELTPDWVCEIASPSTARYDRTAKLPLYERYGVPFVWLIDPIERWLEVHVLDGERYTCSGRIVGDEPIRQPPFEAVAIEVPWLEY